MTAQPTWIRATHPPDKTEWPLTAFDKINFRLVLRGTWIFSEKLDGQQLQESLSELLNFYPHLCGRVYKGATVKLTNQGVSFWEEKRTELTVQALQEEHSLADTLGHPLKGNKVRAGKQEPLSVTCTHIKDGSVLTVFSTHALMDGHSFYHFVSNWSRLALGRSIETPILEQKYAQFALQRSKSEAIQEARRRGWFKVSLWRLLRYLPALLFGNILQRTRPILLDARALQRLRERAERESGCTELSNNDILTAHLSRMQMQLFDHAPETECSQAIVLDTRRRASSIPEHFVGNAALVVKGVDCRADVGLGELALRLHERLGAALPRPSKEIEESIVLAQELMENNVLWSPYNITGSLGKKPTVPYINSFVRFPVYDVHFGTASAPVSPVLVIPHNLPDPILVWPAPPEKTGLEVYFTGVSARAVMRQKQGGAWWQELKAEWS